MTHSRASRRTTLDRAEERIMHGFLPLPENRSGLLAARRFLQRLQSEEFGRKRCPLLFLHGGPGSGKTHLMQTILAQLSQDDSPRSVAIVPAAEIGSEFLKPPGSETLLNEWKALDLLLIEDLQFFPASVADNLANLIDARQSRGSCTIASAGPGPAELRLPGRLTSRLASGVVVHLETFALESRQRFIEHHAQVHQLLLTPEVVAWVASKGSSARELLGELHRLQILAKRFPPPLTLEAACSEPEPSPEEPRPQFLVRRIAEYFDIPVKQITGKARHRGVMWPRQVAIYLLRELLGLPLVRIGTLFGGRDHTTVMHAIEKVKAVMGEDAGAAQEIRKLRAVLQ